MRRNLVHDTTATGFGLLNLQILFHWSVHDSRAAVPAYASNKNFAAQLTCLWWQLLLATKSVHVMIYAFPSIVLGNGPMRSIPTRWKGLLTGMGWSVDGVFASCLFCLWQFRHDLTNASTSLVMLLQKYLHKHAQYYYHQLLWLSVTLMLSFPSSCHAQNAHLACLRDKQTRLSAVEQGQ